MFLLAIAVVTGVSILVFSLLLNPLLSNPQQSILVASIDLAYPSLDLLLLAEAITGFLVFTTTRLKGRIGKAWFLINAAILANVFADMSFSYITLNNTYYNGHPIELLFHWGYLFFALAFFVHAREL